VFPFSIRKGSGTVQNEAQYKELKEWRSQHIQAYLTDNKKLNQFHDELMRKVFNKAFQTIKKQSGEPPCAFLWFVVGSAGRREQGVASDQDHGLVYETKSKKYETYFKSLGEELSFGLNEVGYPYCEGNVMSSNKVWRKSLEEWEEQLLEWMDSQSWESMRYLQIFYDARSIVGEEKYITTLKNKVHDFKKGHPTLLRRFLDNMMHVKKAVGPFGQIFVEDNGAHKDSIHIKNAAFMPYVNSVRLLSIKEGIHATSTLGRLSELCLLPGYKELKPYYENFERLLSYRVSLFKTSTTYDEVHYLNIKKLSKDEKKEVKHILKNGRKLHEYVQKIIKKGC
jgi:CBS domain-containing protein